MMIALQLEEKEKEANQKVNENDKKDKLTLIVDSILTFHLESAGNY